MGVDLHAIQRPEHTEMGRIIGADGLAYERRGTKARRSVVDELVESGAPLVLAMYGRGQLEWFTGVEARATWRDVRPYVVSTAPTAKQLRKHEVWNAGVWESSDGAALVYLTGHC